MSDNLARVIPFTPRTAPKGRPPSVKVRTVVPLRRRPPRRLPVNGHSPDCPYSKNDPLTCGICASERKGRADADP
jgi:hypothetical protein